MKPGGHEQVDAGVVGVVSKRVEFMWLQTPPKKHRSELVLEAKQEKRREGRAIFVCTLAMAERCELGLERCEVGMESSTKCKVSELLRAWEGSGVLDPF